MPLILNSFYRAPAWLVGGHVQTIFPALFRTVPLVTREKERIDLPDGDFLDLAWSRQGSSRLAILSHGLEADYNTAYIQGMAAALVQQGWDVLAWNFRGCGSEPNRLLRMYHSGETEDLHQVITHSLAVHPATKVALCGFSLGGNLVLKYLGEPKFVKSHRLSRALAFSVPCDLACSSHQLSLPKNKIYMERFLIAMRAKLRVKKAMFPDRLNLDGLTKIRTFHEFDDRYTAPIHGFRDAADYWQQNSCRQFLGGIRIPTLLMSAQNDPFLGKNCYPHDEARASDFFHLEVPQTGGHVGFTGAKKGVLYGSEQRAIAFLGH